MSLWDASQHTRATVSSLAKTKDFEQQRAHSKQMTSLTVTSLSTAESEPEPASSKQWGHSAWMQDAFVLSFVFAEVTLFQVYQRLRESSLERFCLMLNCCLLMDLGFLLEEMWFLNELGVIWVIRAIQILFGIPEPLQVYSNDADE